MSWGWQDEHDPPPPQGMAGVGPVARALLEALARTLGADGPKLQATAHDDALLVTGDAAALPWVDGALYLAPRPEAPALWLPTTQRPDVPLDLLERALARRYRVQPLALLPMPAQLVPLARLRPFDAWLVEQIGKRWSRQG